MVADVVTLTIIFVTCSRRKGNTDAGRRGSGKSAKRATGGVATSPMPNRPPSVNKEVDPSQKPSSVTTTTSLPKQEVAPKVQDVKQSAEESSRVR
ncbi:hypothetical protein Y032_0488g2355 [Ancylostoma ceylanicum]|nr:hypothetical protein Y032_0488g2355 [Ancylostoma ceylanicum]